MEKIGCLKCGMLILNATSAKTGGLCMPCNTGTRDAIESSKAYYRKERELDRTDPERLFWKELVSRVHDPNGGFGTLGESEKKYFAAQLLLGEVYNGGFEQFFHNHSGEYFTIASQSLLELGAQRSLRLLRRAKELLFAASEVPSHTPTRRQYLANHPVKDHAPLDALDKEFWSDPDALYEKLSLFGAQHGLFSVAA